MDVSKVEAARDWIPFLTNPLDWEDFLANRGLYPPALPLTRDGFYLHHAFCRYQLMEKDLAEKVEKAEKGKKRKKKADSKDRKKKLVLTSKFLKKVINPGLALLLALDVYQPEEILEVYGEEDKVQEKLGTVVSLTEVDQKKKILGKVTFTLGKKQTLEIKPEEIILLETDKTMELTMDFRLGAARVSGKRKIKIAITGGKVGIVIDARGRPIELEEGEGGWREVKRWMKVFSG